MKEKYIDKFIKELRLHDAEIIWIKYNNGKFTFDISCKLMHPSYYFKDIENIIFSFNIIEIQNINIDFYGSLFIDDLNLDNKDDLYIIKVNNNNDDFYIEFKNYEISYEEVKNHPTNVLLDEFLKSNK